jgi:hypothetical protein
MSQNYLDYLTSYMGVAIIAVKSPMSDSLLGITEETCRLARIKLRKIEHNRMECLNN